MPLDVYAAALLDLVLAAARPPLADISVEEARRSTDESAAALGFEALPSVSMHEEEVLDGGGLRVRIYRPAELEKATACPCILYFHGGGWMIGSLASYDTLCRRLAHDAGCIVVSVGYRLAPEHPFPGAVNDALAAARWLLARSSRLGVDSERIALCGDSAGGNLAAVVGLHADDAGLPPFRCQILLYPVVDVTQTRPSYERYQDYMLTAAAMRTFIERYTPDPATRGDWRVSPLLAPHLDQSPPTVVYTAEYDILHDEGVAFVRRLAELGKNAVHREVPGQMHAFLNFPRAVPAAREVMRNIVADIRAALTPP